MSSSSSSSPSVPIPDPGQHRTTSSVPSTPSRESSGRSSNAAAAPTTPSSSSSSSASSTAAAIPSSSSSSSSSSVIVRTGRVTKHSEWDQEPYALISRSKSSARIHEQEASIRSEIEARLMADINARFSATSSNSSAASAPMSAGTTRSSVAAPSSSAAGGTSSGGGGARATAADGQLHPSKSSSSSAAAAGTTRSGASESSPGPSTLSASSTSSSSAPPSPSPAAFVGGDFHLGDVLPAIRDGFESVAAKNSFIECFQSKSPPRWNYNYRLTLYYCGGVLIRYGILFPLRLTWFLAATLLFLVGITLTMLVGQHESPRSRAVVCGLVRLYAGAWLVSWGAVIRYHGELPKREANQIFVANHSSLIDYIILLTHAPFSSVGQKYTSGVLGFLCNKVLAPLEMIFFERFEEKDRHAVANRIRRHIGDPEKPRLLLFPEGVCVNNEYCVMFKKGAFELDATVCPIAIKFNKQFSDPYWNSRVESFVSHILRLMTSWSTVANIYFLEPQRRLPEESAAEFAERVKALIATRIRLKNVQWDGYLKYYQPSSRFVEFQQKKFADRLLQQMGMAPIPSSSSDSEIATTSGTGSPSPTEINNNGNNNNSDELGGGLRRRRANSRNSLGASELGSKYSTDEILEWNRILLSGKSSPRVSFSEIPDPSSTSSNTSKTSTTSTTSIKPQPSEIEALEEYVREIQTALANLKAVKSSS